MEILYHFHLSPKQQDELTLRQYDELIQAVKKIRAESK